MMKDNLKQMAENLKKALDEMTDEEVEKYFPKDTTPKGWLSIEDHLPKMFAIDIMQGYSAYKVKYADGTEDISFVADHNTWYYRAKEEGITHWFNK